MRERAPAFKSSLAAHELMAATPPADLDVANDRRDPLLLTARDRIDIPPIERVSWKAFIIMVCLAAGVLAWLSVLLGVVAAADRIMGW